MQMAKMTQTREERLALIKAAAEKVAKRNAFKATQKANAASVRRYTDVVEKPRRKAAEEKFDAQMEKLNENYNYWTDAPQYAEKYYGQVYRDTTRFDNEWN